MSRDLVSDGEVVDPSAGLMSRRRQSTISGIIKAQGPGIMLAGAAIGVSHLVQSTQAGANYGFTLLWAIVLANFFKWPFYEFSYRYSAATGETMLEGFLRRGRWMLWVVTLMSLVTGFITVGVVTFVGAAIVSNLLPFLGWGPEVWTIVISLACFALIVLGRYPVLDAIMKAVVGVLTIATIVAFVSALSRLEDHPHSLTMAPSVWDAAGIAFLLGLMGWMPAPVDVGFWPTLWAEERRKQTGYTPTFNESLADFYTGYIVTALMACVFCGLGAIVMFGTGEKFPPQAAPFARKLIEMYTQALGPWAYWVVGIAAVGCMFSTSLTCFDGYPRVVYRGLCLLTGRDHTGARTDWLYWGLTLFFTASAIFVVYALQKSLVQIVMLATVTAFLMAPLQALFHYMVVMGPEVPADYRPPLYLRVCAWGGLLFLAGFAVLYAVTQLMK
jgi:Mn2+/Fe2+ NRAMP family transporter